MTRTDTDGRPTILICEDEDLLRELVRVSLGPDYRFLEAADGREALALVEEEPPDLVLLDLMLPGMTGLEVLRALRENARTASTPVAAISAWTYLEAEAIEAGADRFVPKPFDPGELRAGVEELLGR
jgi:DNA-binding response OmpR family regulator